MMRRASTPRANRVYGPAQVVQTDQPEFSGTAAPGSIIRLALGPAGNPTELTLAGRTVASSTGQWSLTTDHRLMNGQYRVLVTALSRSSPPVRHSRSFPLNR